MTSFADHLTKGVFASRPPASEVPPGSLYSATDTGVVYQSNGTTWSVYVAAPSGGGGGTAGVLLVAAVHVTAAEIVAIGGDGTPGGGTPAELVAAPDSDTVLLWQTVVLSYRAGTVAYDYDPGLLVTWSGFQSIASDVTTSTLNSLIDQTWVFRSGGFNFNTDDPDPALSPQGQALVLTGPSAGSLFSEPFGDGTVDATVYYLEASLAPV